MFSTFYLLQCTLASTASIVLSIDRCFTLVVAGNPRAVLAFFFNLLVALMVSFLQQIKVFFS